MNAISRKRGAALNDYESRPRSGYMTTTEVARLCGVSRFTVINWAKQGRIKTIRTIGRHYRIPASEALSLFRSCDQKKEGSPSGSGKRCSQETPTTNTDEERGNRVTSNEKNEQPRAKKNILYVFSYGGGRGARKLKDRAINLTGRLIGKAKPKKRTDKCTA